MKRESPETEIKFPLQGLLLKALIYISNAILQMLP